MVGNFKEQISPGDARSLVSLIRRLFFALATNEQRASDVEDMPASVD
jgi:hypothetical protein